MGEVSCPQCGNPNLDVDAQNNVVFCKKCGFAVRVDPQTGNVTPLSPGGAQTPASAPMGGGAGFAEHKTVLGMEPFVFLSIALLIVLLGSLIFQFQSITTIIFVVAILLAYFFLRR
ncbi:MAG: TFIIB-type zinc ribbon-containing protein [Candidatus Micrarchaeota archaeon]